MIIDYDYDSATLYRIALFAFSVHRWVHSLHWSQKSATYPKHQSVISMTYKWCKIRGIYSFSLTPVSMSHYLLRCVCDNVWVTQITCFALTSLCPLSTASFWRGNCVAHDHPLAKRPPHRPGSQWLIVRHAIFTSKNAVGNGLYSAWC